MSNEIKALPVTGMVVRAALLLAALASAAWLFSCQRHENEPARRPEKITFAYATLPETAIAQVAHVKGYLLDEGLEETANLHPYGKVALQQVLEGEADFATVAETPLMFAVMDGESVSIIATIHSAKNNHAIVARKDKGILTPQDLKGKRIATTLGITSDFYLDAFLAVRGISRRELTVVDMRPGEYQDAIMNGRVDAVSTFYPYLSRTQKILGDNGITFSDEEIYTETFHVVARQDLIRKQPAKVLKVLRALLKAEQFVRSRPREAQETVAAFSGIEPDIVREAWSDTSFSVGLDQSLILALEDESRWAIDGGLTRARKVPNYLNFIHIDGLKSLKPEAVRILR